MVGQRVKDRIHLSQHFAIIRGCLTAKPAILDQRLGPWQLTSPTHCTPGCELTSGMCSLREMDPQPRMANWIGFVIPVAPPGPPWLPIESLHSPLCA